MRKEVDPVTKIKCFHDRLQSRQKIQQQQLKKLFGEIKGCTIDYDQAKELATGVNKALDRLGVGFKFSDDESTYRLLVVRLPSGKPNFRFQSRKNRLRGSSPVFPDVTKLKLAIPPRANLSITSSHII